MLYLIFAQSLRSYCNESYLATASLLVLRFLACADILATRALLVAGSTF